MLRVARVIAVAACALAPASALAISMGFGIAGASASSGFSVLQLEELSGLGTLTEPNTDGVAFWSLDGPTPIFDGSGAEIARIDSWDVALKEDPYITNNVNVTNTSHYTQVYIVSAAMPIIPGFAYDRVINSSLGVSASDADGNNTLLVDLAGTDFYRGRVDNVNMLTLDPTNLPINTADCTPPNSPGCIVTTSMGVASLSVAPDVADEIQIILRFALSPGDSVGITSRFEIAPSTSSVPEPDTASLLGIGFALLAFTRRRSVAAMCSSAPREV